jgi:ribonuclease BN (tRNA processing enzyme)
LSGGEAQRIRLASQIGSGLVGVMYILDEPSIGLHQRDHERLLETLVRLRDMGNTVLVVEHDRESILSADHVVDLASLMIFGMMRIPKRSAPIPIVGPGPRGCLPWSDAEAMVPASPANPTPGIRDTVEHLLHAYATDINDRRHDAKKPSPWELFEAREIALPAALGFDANLNPFPAMEPIRVFEDDAVRVTTILVKHPPLAPAFAYRIDCDEGSVVVSGDTAPTDNTVRIADRADLLLHEALDMEWAERFYAAFPTAEDQAVLRHHRAAHTSPAQAVSIAEKAGVRTLALHHLVPHSTPGSVWEQMAGPFSGRVIVPDDLAVLPLRS